MWSNFANCFRSPGVPFRIAPPPQAPARTRGKSEDPVCKNSIYCFVPYKSLAIYTKAYHFITMLRNMSWCLCFENMQTNYMWLQKTIINFMKLHLICFIHLYSNYTYTPCYILTMFNCNRLIFSIYLCLSGPTQPGHVSSPKTLLAKAGEAAS